MRPNSLALKEIMFWENIIVYAFSAIPGLEARVAIPFGIFVTELSMTRVIILAFLGAATVALVVTPIIYRFGEHLKARVKYFKKLFEKTQLKHGTRFEEGKLLALFILVALPLPVSGVWTGILVSYIFGIPQKHAIPVLLGGALIGNFAVGLLVVSAGSLLGFGQ